jgi:hypothetical protein
LAPSCRRIRRVLWQCTTGPPPRAPGPRRENLRRVCTNEITGWGCSAFACALPQERWQLAGGARGRGPPHWRNSARAAPASPRESRKRPLLTAHALFLSGRPHSNGPIRGPVRLDPHRAVPNLACTGPGGARAPGNNVRRAPSTAEPSSKHRKFDEHVFSTFV